MSQDVILRTVDDGVMEICLNRPERMNALGVQTVAALGAALADARRLRVRVLLLRGTGKAFCAGADLKERKGMDLPARMAHNAGINEVVNAIAAAPCVTVAVLNGLALGGGLEMALGCDLRIAADGVPLGLTEARVGIFPGAGGTQRLTRLVGTSHALHMMLTAEPVTTAHALAIGLVNEVVAPEALEARAHALARLMATRSGSAQAAIKRLVWHGGERPLAEGLAMERAELPAFMAGADYAEGLAAFEGKRAPRFPSNLS
jgi:enoyl-CoA hydratase/carnithine racemase